MGYYVTLTNSSFSVPETDEVLQVLKDLNEDVFTAAVAQFVEDGSFLDWRGEDGQLWREVVTAGKIVTLEGMVEYR